MSAERKVWFITGGSSGFGRAFAEHALQRGHNIVVAARNAAKLAEVAVLSPDRVLAVTLDVNDSDQIEQAVKATIGRFGRVDVLINNAGYGVVGAIEETPEAELRAQMETNFFGAIAITRAFLPTLRAQRSGAIVNTSSVGGQMSMAGFGAYSASKFALEAASEALSQELKPFGIKVLIVEPGAFRTGFAGAALKPMPVMQEYSQTAGRTRAFVQGMHASQEGDPRKAALAIEEALDTPDTPLRLQLGQDAVSAIRAHAEALLAEMAKWETRVVDTKIATETK